MTLSGKMRADHAGHLCLLAGFVPTANLGDLRRGHEAAHAVQIHQEAALVVVDDLGVDDAVLFVDFLQAPPGLLLPGTIDGNDRVALVILRLNDEDQHRFTDRKGLLLAGCQRGEFLRRHDPFGLRPDVDQDFIPVHPHDGPVHDVPELERSVIIGGIVEVLFHERHGCVWRSPLLGNARNFHTPSL